MAVSNKQKNLLFLTRDDLIENQLGPSNRRGIPTFALAIPQTVWDCLRPSHVRMPAAGGSQQGKIAAFASPMHSNNSGTVSEAQVGATLKTNENAKQPSAIMMTQIKQAVGRFGG
jgi:hypothetical protein